MPGQVEGLICPSSGDTEVLSIQWEPPISNANSVYEYVVEVVEYFQPVNSRVLELRPLAPPFQHGVQFNELLMTAVTSGVGKQVQNHFVLFMYLKVTINC